jgi:hypothetical protein
MEKQILNILNELVEGQKKIDKLMESQKKINELVNSQKDLAENQKKIIGRLDSLDSQVKENTQILKSLEHKANVNTASNWSDIVKLKAVK